MMEIKINKKPAYPPRAAVRHARMTPELYLLEPGHSFTAGREVVAAFRAYARKVGWGTVQRNHGDGEIECWRTS